jgi:hypothetical protein
MEKTCVIAMRKDSLLSQALGAIMLHADPALKVFTSKARNIEDLIAEVSDLKADYIIMEESISLAAEGMLGHLLNSHSNLHVIIVSEETNWLHIFHKRDLLMTRQNDFLSVIEGDC